MRKIDLETRQAFYNCQNYSNDNTRVIANSFTTCVELHGNKIATLNHNDNIMHFNLCSWNTTTTRARINACLPDWCKISQYKGELYFVNLRLNKKVKIDSIGWYDAAELMTKTASI